MVIERSREVIPMTDLPDFLRDRVEEAGVNYHDAMVVTYRSVSIRKLL